MDFKKSLEDLEKALDITQKAGLRYLYGDEVNLLLFQ